MEEKGRELGRKSDPASARLDTDLDTSPRLRQQVRHKLVAAKGRLVEGVQAGRSKVETQVQQHPMKSLAIAFGAGALVGLLLRRRGRQGD
jgi:ElaB/YqjD/DUF883 family membrane-anchored ribosome-binding protein